MPKRELIDGDALATIYTAAFDEARRLAERSGHPDPRQAAISAADRAADRVLGVAMREFIAITAGGKDGHDVDTSSMRCRRCRGDMFRPEVRDSVCLEPVTGDPPPHPLDDPLTPAD